MYVLLDGFVLGAGILFSFLPRDADRDTLMTSVAPIWDGNETWLVLGAGGLFAAFPLAYSIVLPALYLPFMLMLLGLVFRGIAFEFRFKAKRRRHVWDRAFQWGSIAATFCQGLVLGAFVEGFDLDGTRFVGGSLGVGFAVRRRHRARARRGLRAARRDLAHHESAGRSRSVGDGARPRACCCSCSC